jgi:hypothetical protein
MIKNTHLEEIKGSGLHYITAITKPQIEKLLKAGVLQLELFDTELAEIETADGVRYVMRRNPQRALEIDTSIQEKLGTINNAVTKQNSLLPQYSVGICRTRG